MPVKRFVLVFVSLFLLIAGLTPAAWGQANPVSVQAGVESEPLARGSTSRIVIQITVDKPFHIQSAKPHDEFLIPTTVNLKNLPAGITAGTPRFMEPLEIPTPAGLSTAPTLSVYEDVAYILIPITIAPDAPLGATKLQFSLTAQACNDSSCLPPNTEKMSVPVTIAEAGAATQPSKAAMFAAADRQKYVKVETPPPATAPATAPAATTAPAAGANGGLGPQVALLSPEEQLKLIAARPYAPYNTAENSYPVWLIIIFALVGGMILNIMPCVLPVIPLKVLSLVQQAHGDRKLAVMHGLVFSAGVISLFIALAIVLRTFGLFYGQQFQSSAFLIIMVLFVVALSLSMLGVWTINPPQILYDVDSKITSATAGDGLNYAGSGTNATQGGSHRHAYIGSFSNGLMATLLATPCSAPYLGPVLAWALVQPAWLTALALGLVGVGMSLPYLLLAAFPSLLNRIPRAGRWSELLKQGLGIVMIGVAIYLLQLIPNVQIWPWVLLGTVVVGLVCWAWGQIPTPQMALSRVWAIRIVSLVIGMALGAGLIGVGMRVKTVEVATRSDGQWTPFNVALLDAALAQGRPVVVDWTADWCINCHVLEATVLSQESVQGAFRNSNVLLLRADLSTDNPPATALNRKLGGEAIPVLAIFSPGRPYTPVVLRDSYSPSRVVSELQSVN